MQRVLLLGLFLVASASCSVKFDVGKGYHEEIGIPLAKNIKAAEKIPEIKSRTIGGDVAPENAYPFLAGLLITLMTPGFSSVCTASLISNNRLVTAAHCWFDGFHQGRWLTAVLGSNKLYRGGTHIATSSVAMHPQWDPTMAYANDVAIIYLPQRVEFSSIIHPIALPSNELSSDTFVGEWATAAGYGKTSDGGLNRQNPVVNNVNLQVIGGSQCRAFFGNVLSSMLCTSGDGSVGTCTGDSGGPLLINRNGQKILIGVTSFGYRYSCEQGWPSVFSRVTSFRHFIIQHL